MASVNKSKLTGSAQKHLSKGNFDKALKDYQKILKSEPNDTSVRLKVGDLWDRLGDKAQAMAEYRRVASTFTSQGFYSKAIAVLKRIQAAEPDLVEIHIELAELNEKVGLLSEVVHHYQLAANVLDRKGEKREAIDILKRVSEVGPPNLERRVKVAELYYKEGFPKAAYEQFVEATSNLDEHSPELLEVVTRMRKASAQDPKLIVRLGKLYLATGEPKLAIHALEEAMAIEEDPLTLELLGEANLHLELLGDAKVFFEKAADLHEAAGDRDKSRDLAARINEISEMILEGPGALLRESSGEAPDRSEESAGEEIPGEAAEEAGTEAAEKSAEEPPGETLEESQETAVEGGAEGETEPPEEAAAEIAKELIKGARGSYEIEVAGSEKTRDASPPEEADDLSEDERLEVTFSEAEVYRKYGKIEGAGRILEKLAVRFPHREEPRIRLKEMYESTEEWVKVADQCRRLALVATLRGDEFRASRFLEEAKETLVRIAGMPVAGVIRETKASEAPPEPEIPPLDEEPGEAPPEPVVDKAPEEPIDSSMTIEDIQIRPDAFQEDHEEPGSETEEKLPALSAGGALDDLEILIDDEGVNPGGAPLAVETGEVNGDEIEPQLVIDGPGALPSDEALSNSDIEAEEETAANTEAEEEADAGEEETIEASGFEEEESEEEAAEEEEEEEEEIIEASGVEEEEAAEETTEEEAAEGEEETIEASGAEEEVAEEEAAEGEEEAIEASGVEEEESEEAEESVEEAAEEVAEAEEEEEVEEEVEEEEEEETIAASGFEEEVAEEEAAEETTEEEAAAEGEEEAIEASGAEEEESEEEEESVEEVAEEETASENNVLPPDDLEQDPAVAFAARMAAREREEAESEPEDDEEIYILDEPEDEEGVPPSWDWGPEDGRLSSSDGEKTDEAPMAGAQSESEASPGPGVSRDESGPSAFDLRAELERDEGAEDGIGEVSDATEELIDLVGELRIRESDAPDSFDSQTRYDLGIAYKEMGLLDDAIRELTLAAKDTERRIESCAVLGVCYRLQGRPEDAARMIEECLGDSAITVENAPGLLYEMAIAHEDMGDPGKALDWYDRVARIDPEFGDIKARISALKSNRKKKKG